MSLEEFIEKCLQCGYITGPNGRRRLRDWAEKNPKDNYTSEDFIEVYRYFQTLDIKHEPKLDHEVVYIKFARGSTKSDELTWGKICEYLSMGKTVAVKHEDGYHWFYPDDYYLG